MALVVSQDIEGQYEVQLCEPEQTWLKILAGKMVLDELSVLSIALERGLVELMSMFGKPDKPTAADL